LILDLRNVLNVYGDQTLVLDCRKHGVPFGPQTHPC
jgi:hypothetical protein